MDDISTSSDKLLNNTKLFVTVPKIISKRLQLHEIDLRIWNKSISNKANNKSLRWKSRNLS